MQTPGKKLPTQLATTNVQYEGKYYTNACGLGRGPMAHPSKHGNRPSGSIKGGKIIY